MRRRTTSKVMAMAAVVAMTVAASAAVAGQGVELGLRDAPTAGSTGVLVSKAQTSLKGNVAALQSASEIEPRPESGTGGAGVGTLDGTAPGAQIQPMDQVQVGGGWLCRVLENSPLGQYVDIALRCD
jgi:hypothetical protein